MDHRKEKRGLRKIGMDDPVYTAYQEGQAAAMWGNKMPRRYRTNPYRPGRRHDSWNDGYNQADPLGEHHGRNE